jgi:hypothetical protein
LDLGGATGMERNFSNPDLTKAFGRLTNNSLLKGDDFGPLTDDVSL